MTILRRAANRVEETEMARQIPAAMFLFHRGFDAALHFLGLAAQHGGLVGDPDRLEVDVRIEPGRVRAFELFQELLFIAAVQNIAAHVIGFSEVIDDEVMPGAVGGRLRSGRLGFLVLGLAVNDARDRFLRVLPDALPNAHHVAARCIHHDAACLFQFLARDHFGAERGNNDNILAAQAADFLVGRLWRNGLDAHVADLVVHFRVMDDFAEQINRFGRRKHFAGGVSQVDGAFDAVTEPEFLRQLDGEPAVGGEDAAVSADAVHQFAAIMGDDLRLHGLHRVGPAQIHLLRRAGRLS